MALSKLRIPDETANSAPPMGLPLVAPRLQIKPQTPVSPEPAHLLAQEDYADDSVASRMRHMELGDEPNPLTVQTADYAPTLSGPDEQALYDAAETETAVSYPDSILGTPPASSNVRMPVEGGRRQVSWFQRGVEVLVYPIFAGVVIKDLAPFFRQLAAMINAGMPIYQALHSLELSTPNRKLREIAGVAQRQVLVGGNLSDVMQTYPWIFSNMQTSLVRAAEIGGMLDKTLLQIADYVEHELEIRRLVSRETFYPKMVMVATLFIIGRSGFFGGMPAVSLLVLGAMGNRVYTFANYLSDTVGFGALIAVPILAIVAAFRLSLFNVPGIREMYDRIKMGFPGLGKLVYQFAVSKFARTLAALYRGGFHIGTSLAIAGDACGNGVIGRAASRAVPKVEAGVLMSDALAESRRFDPMTLDMIRTGELSGNLDTMLDKVAEFHENEASTKSHMLAIALGVLVFLIIAIAVGVSVISQYNTNIAGPFKELMNDKGQ